MSNITRKITRNQLKDLYIQQCKEIERLNNKIHDISETLNETYNDRTELRNKNNRLNRLLSIEKEYREKFDKDNQRLNKRIEDLNIINEEHNTLNGMIRKELQQKENIIKEVRKHLQETINRWEDYEQFYEVVEEDKYILEILDKGEINE